MIAGLAAWSVPANSFCLVAQDNGKRCLGYNVSPEEKAVGDRCYDPRFDSRQPEYVFRFHYGPNAAQESYGFHVAEQKWQAAWRQQFQKYAKSPMSTCMFILTRNFGIHGYPMLPFNDAGLQCISQVEKICTNIVEQDKRLLPPPAALSTVTSNPNIVNPPAQPQRNPVADAETRECLLARNMADGQCESSGSSAARVGFPAYTACVEQELRELGWDMGCNRIR